MTTYNCKSWMNFSRSEERSRVSWGVVDNFSFEIIVGNFTVQSYQIEACQLNSIGKERLNFKFLKYLNYLDPNHFILCKLRFQVESHPCNEFVRKDGYNPRIIMARSACSHTFYTTYVNLL